MNAVQLNTRVSAELRNKGQQSFKNVGLNLSDAIRLYLEFASKNLMHPENILKVLDSMKGEKSDSEISKKLEVIQDSQKIVQKFNDKYGINIQFVNNSSTSSYKELREQAFDDLRMKKIGK